MKYFFLISVCVFVLISCKNNNTLFQEIPSSESGIDFKNTLLEKKAFGILYYLYYFNGGGVSVGDINNDGLQDVYFTSNNKSANKLYLNKGNFKFEDITSSAGVSGSSDWCTGATMADVNGDGLLDIYVSAMVNDQYRLKGHNELFINQGNNQFVEKSEEYGLSFSGYSTQSAFFDYDHDGDLDCYVLNQSLQPNQNIRPAAGRTDFDAKAGDRFYRNENGKTFTDISKQAGIFQSNLGYGLGITVADFNNDGFEDVYIGNDFHENDYYYLNNGKGAFVESGEKHFRHYSRFSMGNDAADYDNDGQLDLVTVDMLPDNEKVLKTYGSDEQFDSYQYKILSNGYQYQFSKNCLQKNNGNGQSFSEVGLMAGVSATDWSWCPLFADFDNDGRKDLFISSGIVKRPVDLDYVKYVSTMFMTKGMDKTDKYDKDALEKMPDGASHPFFFKGNAEGAFSDVSKDWGTSDMKGYYNGAAYTDLDNDGDLDMLINTIGKDAVVLKNNAEENNKSIEIKFKGDKLNTFGLGAKVYVFANHTMQYQQLEATHGFESSSQQLLHFGLDKSSKIDSMLVIWPSQKYQIFKNINLKQLNVKEVEANGLFQYTSFFPSSKPIISNITVQTGLIWSHNENFFNDFSLEPLLPHKQSTIGPKIAVADLNNDGLDDFYVCGASGQSGQFMTQTHEGKFVKSTNKVFENDAKFEDVDAVFFDANNDHFQDLLVLSGGNQFMPNDPLLADRLYLNNGKGDFTKAEFPQILANKGAVSVADIDQDGDQDVFIGLLNDSRAYGILKDSKLLINNGKGKFSFSNEKQIDLKQLGLVKTAQFADVNHDTWPDLVVAGEFMPITIFMNKNGIFEKENIDKSSGWWQIISINDVNGDGNLDILGGNWGLNNKFSSQKDGQVKMYVKDFDNNGNIDQLISYQLQGKEYPFLAKDEVERPMPVLRQHYKLYNEFAGLEMKDAYYGFVEQVEPLMAQSLKSAIAYGDGNGNFELEALPFALQKAPIFAFQKINANLYICGGNFFESQPYEGRYDAQPLAIFNFKNKKINYVHQDEIYNYNAQVRDIKTLRTINNKKIILVAFNNAPLEVFAIN